MRTRPFLRVRVFYSSGAAWQADAFIPYKCKKGECGTCSVLIDGKWVQACQTKIPAVARGEAFQVLFFRRWMRACTERRGACFLHA
jgi:hypothetical protein